MIFTFLEGLLAFVLVLGPLVFIHELGHFLVAKAFGVAVPVFSIGFGPRLFGFRRRETDYRVSLIPLGGYVRMAGDESDEHRSGLPHEFLSKPKWQRFFVFVAGAAFNVALAFLLFWAIFAVWGVDEARNPDRYPTVMSVAEGSPAAAAGVERGDVLLEIGGSDVRGADRYQDVYNYEVVLSPGKTQPIAVERDGRRYDLSLTIASNPTYGHGAPPGWYLTWGGDETATVQAVVESMPALEAGFLAGDRIVGAEGQSPIGEIDLRTLIESSAGVPLAIEVEREGERVALDVVPVEQDGRGQIGVVFRRQLVHRDLGWVEAARESWEINRKNSVMLFVVLKRMVTTEVPLKSVSGPIGIAQVARQAVLTDVRAFLWLMAFFSLQLGILNLLPIPVLDGGHILILLIEGVLGRELSDTIKERVMAVGFVFLLGFMSVVILMDVKKIIF